MPYLLSLYQVQVFVRTPILTWVKKAEPIAVDNNKTITQADYQAMLKKMARIEEENEILKKAMAIFAKK